MADADDFDVEYFRRLLQGGGGAKAEPQPASPAKPARKAGAGKTAGGDGGAEKGKAKPARKKA